MAEHVATSTDGVGPSPNELAVDGDCDGLTDVELVVLELEPSWWKYQGAKESMIRERLGMSLTRYYQVLNALLDRPEALAADPLTVKSPAPAAC